MLKADVDLGRVDAPQAPNGLVQHILEVRLVVAGQKSVQCTRDVAAMLADPGLEKIHEFAPQAQSSISRLKNFGLST